MFEDKDNKLVGNTCNSTQKTNTGNESCAKHTEEVGINQANGKTVVKINPDFFRPAEVEVLLGNPAKAETVLGWKRNISFQELVRRMVQNDLALTADQLN